MQINVDGYGEQKTYACSSFLPEIAKVEFGVWCLVFGARSLKEQNIQYAFIPFFFLHEKRR